MTILHRNIDQLARLLAANGFPVDHLRYPGDAGYGEQIFTVAGLSVKLGYLYDYEETIFRVEAIHDDPWVPFGMLDLAQVAEMAVPEKVMLEYTRDLIQEIAERADTYSKSLTRLIEENL